MRNPLQHTSEILPKMQEMVNLLGVVTQKRPCDEALEFLRMRKLFSRRAFSHSEKGCGGPLGQESGLSCS
jgi:hypothetical protein